MEKLMILILIMVIMCMLSFEVGWQFARHLYSWEREMIEEWREMYWKLWNKTK